MKKHPSLFQAIVFLICFLAALQHVYTGDMVESTEAYCIAKKILCFFFALLFLFLGCYLALLQGYFEKRIKEEIGHSQS